MATTLSQKLKDLTLIDTGCQINGKSIKTAEDNLLEVENPATKEIIARISNAGSKEAKLAISAAHDASKIWNKKTAREKRDILNEWARLIKEAKEDLANIITLENGKPISQATAEVESTIEAIKWFASLCCQIDGRVCTPISNNKEVIVIKQPIGVVAAITPWNFPLLLVIRKIAPAIASGCTVVLKPSELTPLISIAMMKLAYKSGIPDGVINVVFGDKVAIGNEMLNSPIVKKITFTGSLAVGKYIAENASKTIKRVSLELGGNAPVIIFNDADLEMAVNLVMKLGLNNAGQVCISANRIYVQNEIFNEFSEKLKIKIEKMKIGNGLDPSVQLGPLITTENVDRIDKLVEDATKKGAKIMTGGNRSKNLNGNFFDPTLLSDVNDEMRMVKEEIFGPLIPLIKFSTEDEVIKMANDTYYGLAAYFFTKDLARTWRVAKKLEFGMIGVNDNYLSPENTPFGGMKMSGYGRENSYEGFESFLETKAIHMGLGYKN